MSENYGLGNNIIFNSIIALTMPVIASKVVETITKGDNISSFLQIIKNNDIMVVSGMVFIVSYIVAALGNWDSGKKKCPTNNPSNQMTLLLSNSIKVPVIVWIGFLMGVLLPPFQGPWINLLSNFMDKNNLISNELVNMLPYICGGFIGMCLSWFATALSYFGYVQNKCAITNETVADEIKTRAGLSSSAKE